MIVNEVTKIYAGALLEIGNENNLLSIILEECEFIVQILSDDDELRNFLNAPIISKESKKKFVDNVFSGKLCDEIIGFLKVLIDKDRQSLFLEIYKSLIDLIDNQNKTRRVALISAIKLEVAQIESIKNALSQKLGVDIVVEERIENAIMGGIIIEIDDIVIDGSIAGNLGRMKEGLLTSKVMSGVAYED